VVTIALTVVLILILKSFETVLKELNPRRKSEAKDGRNDVQCQLLLIAFVYTVSQDKECAKISCSDFDSKTSIMLL
jgi:hypothetical protein